MTGSHRDDTGEHRSLEETVLENIDAAAKSAEVPAMLALQQSRFTRNVVIWLALYSGFVAFACTYAIWEVQKQNSRITNYLITTCSSGNETRKAEKFVIDTLLLEELTLAELQGYKPSKEELAALERIEAAAIAAYPELDCNKVEDGQRVIITPLPTVK